MVKGSGAIETPPIWVIVLSPSHISLNRLPTTEPLSREELRIECTRALVYVRLKARANSWGQSSLTLRALRWSSNLFNIEMPHEFRQMIPDTELMAWTGYEGQVVNINLGDALAVHYQLTAIS